MMTTPLAPSADDQVAKQTDDSAPESLKYHLLGPSLTKAGQESVDQTKVSELIYQASKGSKFFNREEVRDRALTQKIERILERKRALDDHQVHRHLRLADRLVVELEATRDLTQHLVHLDCDAFYAAVEQLERPELTDVPFAVGAGVLTTCNYRARHFGCRSGMAAFVAKKLCPSLVLIRPNFQKYSAKARQVRQILAEYDPRFESASIDEAYLNLTDYCTFHGTAPAEVVDQMRREIHQKTGITVSAGIAANTRLAKICSNVNKPDGQFLLPNDRNAIISFLRSLPTRKVNGIGRVLERELSELGVKTCGQIYDERKYLCLLFGHKTADFLLRCCLGLGRTRIQPAGEYERKSISTESTFGHLSDPSRLREKLRWTAEELERDMQRAQCKGRTLCLKVKLHTFEVLTRQVVLPRAIFLAEDLYNFSLPMLARLEQESPGMRLRLLGLRCTHLISNKKPDTLAFFGLKQQQRPPHGNDEAPQHSLTEPPVVEAAELFQPGHVAGPPEDSSKQHSMPPATRPGSDPTEGNGSWECPICLRLQSANERLFNQHIDLCLSRQTIRKALQEDGRGEGRLAAPIRKARPPDKRRGKSTSIDPKQKKIAFT